MKRKKSLKLILLLIGFGLIFSPVIANALELTLAWDPNTEDNLAGYKVYYKIGASGEPYNGTGATEGASPIDVGNVTEFTLRGLSNDLGTIYRFVVTAYNTDVPSLESGYSNEVANRCALTVTIVGSGVVVQDPPSVGGMQESGLTVTLTAQPDQFWGFTAWSEDITSTNPIEILHMDGNDKNVTATFTEKATYTLTVNVIGNGTVSLAPAGGIYHDGETVTMTATPAGGWEFTGWTGGITSTSNPYQLTISANTTVNAVFTGLPLNPPTDMKVVVP